MVEWSGLLNEAINAVADKALMELCQLDGTVSKAQAYRLYGRDHVDRWCMESLIHPVCPVGAKKRFIDRLKLEAVARASNRTTDLPLADL